MNRMIWVYRQSATIKKSKQSDVQAALKAHIYVTLLYVMPA